MNTKALKITTLLCAMLMLFLTACSAPAPQGSADKDTVLRLGTFAGGSDTAAQLVMNELTNRGWKVETEIFTDNNGPASALRDGDVDMVLGNSSKWMDTFCSENNCDFTMPEPRYFYTAIGLYSLKFDSLDAFPQNAQVCIANDATNRQKALQLLQDAGLLKLSETPRDAFYTVFDIVDNPYNIEFVEADIMNTAVAVVDVDAVVATSTAISKTGSVHPNDYLFRDPNPTPIGFFMRTEDAQSDWAKDICDIIGSGIVNEDFNAALEGSYFLISEWE